MSGVGNGMKASLIGGDIGRALTFHHDIAKQRYETVYSLLGSSLPAKVQQMQGIELVFAEGDRAKYRIKRKQNMGGQVVIMTYYIYFSKDESGLWKIEKY